MTILKSKKFWASVSAVIAAVGAGFTGAQPWGTVIMEVVGAIMAYVAAQGIADAGKEKALVEKGK